MWQKHPGSSFGWLSCVFFLFSECSRCRLKTVPHSSSWGKYCTLHSGACNNYLMFNQAERGWALGSYLYARWRPRSLSSYSKFCTRMLIGLMLARFLLCSEYCERISRKKIEAPKNYSIIVSCEVRITFPFFFTVISIIETHELYPQRFPQVVAWGCRHCSETAWQWSPPRRYVKRLRKNCAMYWKKNVRLV